MIYENTLCLNTAQGLERHLKILLSITNASFVVAFVLMEGDSCFLYRILPPKPHDISLYVKRGSFLVCVFLFCFVLQTERVIYASNNSTLG